MFVQVEGEEDVSHAVEVEVGGVACVRIHRKRVDDICLDDGAMIQDHRGREQTPRFTCNLVKFATSLDARWVPYYPCKL